MSWEGNVARIGEKKNSYRISVGKAGRKRKLKEDIDIGGRITLRWILKK
jgi:hypothetical protein